MRRMQQQLDQLLGANTGEEVHLVEQSQSVC